MLVAALALVAAWSGASLADLGLEQARLPAGLRYGLVALAVVGIALALAAEIPLTEVALHDRRAEISGGHLLYELLVTVVLLTAIPEELPFRGVLLGSALAAWEPRRAGVVTAVLFGFWHVQPTLQTMADNRAVGGANAGPVGAARVVVPVSVGSTAMASSPEVTASDI